MASLASGDLFDGHPDSNDPVLVDEYAFLGFELAPPISDVPCLVNDLACLSPSGLGCIPRLLSLGTFLHQAGLPDGKLLGSLPDHSEEVVRKGVVRES
ncbi:MAG: hypothetical protein EA350_14770 [Gemmatimonadales bacterium]|nr:MAG: hypothetical protein EA350_14770 [Gemmatimonadales bacterium]